METEPQSEENRIRSAVNHWREAVLRETQRPDWFWSRQRARIQSAISESTPRVPKLVWAAVAATFALAIALVVPAQHPDAPTLHQAKTVTPHATQLSDHELMLAVERTLNAGVPSSLEPAGMLAQEMNEAFQQNVQTQKSSKETNYAN